MTGRCAAALVLFALPLAGLAAQLHSGDAIAIVDAGRISIERDGTPIVRLTDIRFNFTSARSWEIAEEHPAEVVLIGRFPAAVDYYKHADDLDERKVTLTIDAGANGFHLHAAPDWGRQVTLEFEYLGDRFFGLSEPLQPDNRLSPDLTGSTVDVEIESEGAAWRENYASAWSAFYMSSAGYGAFFDSFARGRYEFAVNGRNRIRHDTGTLDWYVFPGADGRQIHAAYFDLIGAPKPVPAWGLGPVGWRDQNDGGAAEILADVEHMTALRLPFTAWFVDRPYSDGAHAWSKMNFGEKFANPGEWIGTLRDDFGLEFMTWVAPATFGDTRFERHLAGGYTYLDLTHPETVAAYVQALYDEQYVHGVKGHKIDRADEHFPVDEEWYDASVPVAERRNKYVYLLSRIQDAVLRAVWGGDQMTFARAAIHRTQPFLSAIWAGDPRASWDGLRANFANAARAAFLGFPVWGSDVGGYQGEGFIPRDLYVRWLQAGSMSGLFEIKLDGAGGSGRDRLPWRYDEEFQRIFRQIGEDRMRLIPYLYSLSRTASKTGTLMQPPAYRHLRDRNTWNLWDEFYVGDAILVAPVFERSTRRSVYLPAGTWRDFDDPAVVYDGGRMIEVDAPLDKLPRFVRANSLFVTGNVYRGSDRTWREDEPRLTIHAFPAATDSATSFDYVDMLDDDAVKSISMRRDGSTVRLATPSMTIPARVEFRLDTEPRAVTLNGEEMTVDYDAATKTLAITVAPGSGADIEIWLEAHTADAGRFRTRERLKKTVGYYSPAEKS